MQIKKSHCRNTSPLPEKSFIVRNRRRQRGNEIIPQVTRLFPKPVFNALSLLDDLCVPTKIYISTNIQFTCNPQQPTSFVGKHNLFLHLASQCCHHTPGLTKTATSNEKCLNNSIMSQLKLAEPKIDSGD